ncbi:sortilin-related receptor-like [Diorhabda carinulata]|uniref:sortilin-related receptor-like n=1 Tax=Diorhabda carinulata TaxID=1163345 RepID=UPI0025A03DF5|nr:sortilin-related receptor-like [Diorhabda carinulata]
MYLVLFLLLFTKSAILLTVGFENNVKTLFGNLDDVEKLQRSHQFDAVSSNFPSHESVRRERREVSSAASNIVTKINYLNDSHKQLMVHWVGDNSKIIICLARDPAPTISGFSLPSSSTVFISYDDGDSYINKTDHFKLDNGEYAVLEKFYNHPKIHTHFVVTDIKHNVMYVTTDYGKTFIRRDLNFTPSEVSFHELYPSIMLVLDKNHIKNKLWVTEDFGETFRPLYEYVKAYFWMKDVDETYHVIIQRSEPNNLSSIIHSSNLFKHTASQIYNTNVKDFFIKGDYLFTTSYTSKGELNLYVSYKFGKRQLCVFDSTEKFQSFLIVDVTNPRALVAAGHTNTTSHLYTSENLAGDGQEVKFTLSLEDVFVFFPLSSWQDTWLHHMSEEAFADVYKVEGITGIYIASKVLSKPVGGHLGPQHLGSVITFDHGATWKLIQPPAFYVDGQSTGCVSTNNCSLHLSQKFNQLLPDTRSVGILSSKSAPGIIMATGVLGKNLKGHYGIYISLDAGVTWRHTLMDLYFFNMGDHGGILSAVKYYKTKGETRHIEYSIDEGRSWNQTEFHNEELRLYGLMTEPGENTTVFTMFGSLPERHQWIIVKVDFTKLFPRKCTKGDYKMWYPSYSEQNRNYIPCILGQQVTYQRRIPLVNCLNGLDYVQETSIVNCECDLLDFECDFGFTLVGSPPRCIRDKTLPINVYKIPTSCKPGEFFNRTKGYRKIAVDKCIGGFESHYLPDLVPCPFKEVNDFILFAQRERISRYNLVTKKLEKLPISNLKNVITIDFDTAENCVYWADIAEDTISRQCFSNGTTVEVLISNDLASIEGMAFDWISKTLYFVDGVRAKIELIRTDIHNSGRMRRTILNSTVLHKPRGIVLHPQNGYMFWTDWSVENPSVNRANLDGTNNLTLFGRNKVEWPNGITIDYIANRLYWVDARLDYIGSSDLHGDGFIKVVYNTDVVSHPFAISVFKNNMYWDDWKRNSIFAADKDNFTGVEIILKQMPGLMDLKVFAHGLQIGTNACTKSDCSYICVGLPKGGHACLCPDGLIMQNGKCMCPGNVEPLVNLTCPSVGNSCSPEHFTCNNHLCIPKGWKCDGEDDCGDGSDEFQCITETCPPSFFICGDGKCLPNYWRCDYDTDCADGSDEANCPRQNCTAGQFACENGRCISSKWRCDGENDCRDESDERNCNEGKPTSCKGEEFTCKSGGVICIPTTWKCDGESDCTDGSDEFSCLNNTCTDAQMACGPPNNRCIYKTWICDGDTDCTDGRDEKNCSFSTMEVPKLPEEFESKNGTCHDPWMFRCRTQRCIPFWWKCDGADDCEDGSDELGCNTPVYPPMEPTSQRPNTICENNQFQCEQGDCITASFVCDGMDDCLHGEDEKNCKTFMNCTHTQFQCRNDGSCIPKSAVCDNHFDCVDKTDEQYCEHNLPDGPGAPSCSFGLFPCDETCYPLSLYCDGKIDCKDGYDERNCSKKSRVYQVLMEVDERFTTSNSFYLRWWTPQAPAIKFEYLPSIKKIGNDQWKNESWTSQNFYNFTNLQPFTKYNLTVYVKIQNTSVIFPPAMFNVSSTAEGTPSEPWNVTVKQRNGSHILVSWNKPRTPNGIIVSYELCWISPKSAEVRLKLLGNETAHLLTQDFEHGLNYTFWVIVHNRKYESVKSAPVHLIFDGETNVSMVKNISVIESDDSISLKWIYDGEADGFNVRTFADRPYPDLPSRITKTTNITIKLASGTNYRFEINAFKKDLTGATKSITVKKSGHPLPAIDSLQVTLMKDVGTSVKMRWEKPKYLKMLSWLYGIYYGTNHDQLFEKPRYTTNIENIIISNLQPCESYIFSIGLVGPVGYGPLSGYIKQITTSGNPKSPPKRLQVEADGDDPIKMKISWIPPCSSIQPEFYKILIQEKSTTLTSLRKVNGSHTNSYVFTILHGGVYEIKVATGEPDAIYSQPVTYYAPSIQAPIEIRVLTYPNGSYIVDWKDSNLPKNIGKYKYEILVQNGNTLNETLAQKFTVEKSPFIYTNLSYNSYTFAVRIKTAKGLNSQTSELISRENPYVEVPSNMTAIIVPSMIVLVALLAVITFLIIRNKKIQNSFTRFSNSHYDTRSQAATFDDNNLEEDDGPHIGGFSDDEPLVIA